MVLRLVIVAADNLINDNVETVPAPAQERLSLELHNLCDETRLRLVLDTQQVVDLVGEFLQLVHCLLKGKLTVVAGNLAIPNAVDKAGWHSIVAPPEEFKGQIHLTVHFLIDEVIFILLAGQYQALEVADVILELAEGDGKVQFSERINKDEAESEPKEQEWII